MSQYHVTTCHVTTCLVTIYHITTDLVTICHLSACHTTSCNVIASRGSCCILSCHNLSRHTLSCFCLSCNLLRSVTQQSVILQPSMDMAYVTFCRISACHATVMAFQVTQPVSNCLSCSNLSMRDYPDFVWSIDLVCRWAVTMSNIVNVFKRLSARHCAIWNKIFPCLGLLHL